MTTTANAIPGATSAQLEPGRVGPANDCEPTHYDLHVYMPVYVSVRGVQASCDLGELVRKSADAALAHLRRGLALCPSATVAIGTLGRHEVDRPHDADDVSLILVDAKTNLPDGDGTVVWTESYSPDGELIKD